MLNEDYRDMLHALSDEKVKFLLSVPMFSLWPLQRFFWNEISEGFRPVDIKWQAFGGDPVFFRARPISLPKTTYGL